MENVSEREFMKKFGMLTPQNQRYLVCVQEALSFAQQTVHQKEDKNSKGEKLMSVENTSLQDCV